MTLTINEKTQFLHTLSAALTEAEGKAWFVDNAPWTVTWEQPVLCLTHGNEVIYIQAVKERGKIDISGHLTPELNRIYRPGPYEHSDPDNPHITASLSRGPVAIAKDIVRKVLPGYRALHELLGLRLADDIAYENRQHTVANKLAALIGTTVDRDGDFGKVVGEVHIYRASVTGSDPVSVRMDVRGLSEAQAVKILNIIKEG